MLLEIHTWHLQLVSDPPDLLNRRIDACGQWKVSDWHLRPSPVLELSIRLCENRVFTSQTGQVETAIRRLEEALSYESDNAATNCLLASAYDRNGQSDQARIYAENCNSLTGGTNLN